MVHEDFFEKILIEFVEWQDGKEHVITKFDDFDQMPSDLQKNYQSLSSIVFLNNTPWKILGIDKNIRAHGRGAHIKVKIEKTTV